MRRTLTLITVPVCVLVFLSGCGLATRGPVVSGPVVSEERSIDIATSVVLDSWGDLTIREGEPSLVIRAPAAVLKRLTADVNDGELVLGVKPGSPMISNARVEYELTMPSLEGIAISGSGSVDSVVPGDDLTVDISGSGDVDIDSIDASSVTLDLSGSGDIRFSGRADELTVSMARETSVPKRSVLRG
jgi:Putative auto-transporter adhesin, head GIN domain